LPRDGLPSLACTLFESHLAGNIHHELPLPPPATKFHVALPLPRASF